MLFGVNPSVRFEAREPGEDQLSLCVAAEIQHRFACHINEHLAKRRATQKALAAKARMDRTRLGRLLNGRTPMRLADIGRLTAALKLELPEWPELR